MIVENLRIALRGLAANKLRAGLTMLGIVIGVAAVITLLSVGKGVEQFVTAQFQSIGSNLLFVFEGSPNGDSGQRTRPLTNADAGALSTDFRAADILAVAPEWDGFARVDYRRESADLRVAGVTPEYTRLRDWPVAAGDFVTEGDLRGSARIVVLGATAYKTLFPEGEDPLGATIKIKDINFRVAGVMAERGGNAFGDEDNVVFVPLSTAQERLFPARTRDGQLRVSFIYVQAASAERMEAAAAQVTEVLRDRHDIRFRDEDDFSVITQSDLISAFGEVTGVLTIFLGAIAGISLLVGGIGIMNIMLVSVTARTREIGLRKAVGARRADILGQFLIEAITLSLLGGVIGIAIGAVGSQLVSGLARDLQVRVTLDSVLLATGFSAAVGLFFGIYPATRAARLHPIDALRYE